MWGYCLVSLTPNTNDILNKEDLYLLLESYKNSVEMYTVISQQLTNILESAKQIRDESVVRDDGILEKIKVLIDACEKIKEKMEDHNTNSRLGIGKLSGKINLLYVAFGSIVLSLIILIGTILHRNNLIEAIAHHLGVG